MRISFKCAWLGIIRSGVFFLLFLLPVFNASGQEPTYDLKFLNADHMNSEKLGVVSVFAVTPRAGETHFPPIVSMKVGYRVNDEKTFTYLTETSEQGASYRIAIYGKDFQEKSKRLYRLVQNEIAVDDFDQILFLVIFLRGISDSPVETMDLQYGLWEKQNAEKRVEQVFEVTFKDFK